MIPPYAPLERLLGGTPMLLCQAPREVIPERMLTRDEPVAWRSRCLICTTPMYQAGPIGPSEDSSTLPTGMEQTHESNQGR
jgi:hypothetical protein